MFNFHKPKSESFHELQLLYQFIWIAVQVIGEDEQKELDN